ncbi:helix-turn-helix domain-containing protein [Amycolatopsis umgeniensis]|uniref:Transcriptional regulator with XRE-family HTH domain n=1 Tax=Amycolatopsis umgeniensis TaxID=336628 RepID=A0A841AU79_9PSEU|nr:helix-turn-helix transcriptional regulator [Amycolatopsis umgeniensis]MBB5850201.1 transcriptional regulator with XRE-family HTH domain [Amycolatopsis umgeniensis]
MQSTARSRLAAELRRLRDLSGVSGRKLAHLVSISQSKVSRIESGAVIPSLPEVTAWGRALGAPEETLQQLTFLTKQAFTEVQPWRELLEDQSHIQDEVGEQERRARRVRTFQSSVVPGLLQTADYARRVFATYQPPYGEEEISAAVAARLNRQQLIFEPDRQFDFVITEGALRWCPGPPRGLLAQWDRIASIVTLDNVSIGLIPYHQEAVTLLSHSFVIYDDDDAEHSWVTLEMIHGTMTVSDPHDVMIYGQRWSSLRQMAVFGQDARDYLAVLADGVRTSAP